MALLFPLEKSIKEKLEKLIKSYTSPENLIFRARIILLASIGKSHGAIARTLKTTLATIRKWVTRFNEKFSLDSLKDAPRSGKPHILPALAKCEVIKFACSDVKEAGLLFDNMWTIRALQQCVKNSTGIFISKSEISRILNHKDLRPHRIKMWLHSPDPLFKEKVNKIVSLYLKPPEDAIVLCVDEKGGMQAVERKRSLAPKSKGCEVRLDYEYKRHGTQTLIAAYNAKTGHIFGQCGKSRKKEDIMRFMEEIAQKYPLKQIYIIWDNLNIHHGYRWYEFNKRHGERFHFTYTPIHGSWTNQIEVWFGILQRKVLKNSSFTSESDLKKAVLQYVKHWNEQECHPFKWQFKGYQSEAA